jgi:hypothetical protein
MRKTTTRLEHLSTRCTVKKINTSTAPVDALGYLTFDKLQNRLFRGLCGFAMGRPPRVPKPMIPPSDDRRSPGGRYRRAIVSMARPILGVVDLVHDVI